MASLYEHKVAEPRFFPRISWGAIIAGTVVAIGTQIMLTLLGISIGLASINPFQEQNPGGLSMGAAIWFAISGIIALFIGGWIAGRLSGEHSKIDKALNGLVVWGLSLILMVYLTTAAAGAVIGGAFSLAKAGVGAAGQAIGAAAPAAQQLMGGQSGPLADLQKQSQQIINSVQNATPQERQKAQKDAEVLSSAIGELAKNGQLSSQSRQAVKNVLVARGNMPSQQADSYISQAEQQAQQTRTALGAAADTAKVVAEKATSAASKASLALFFVLLLDALAAMAGGYLSPDPIKTREDLRSVRTDRDDAQLAA